MEVDDLQPHQVQWNFNIPITWDGISPPAGLQVQADDDSWLNAIGCVQPTATRLVLNYSTAKTIESGNAWQIIAPPTHIAEAARFDTNETGTLG